jgi:hypothetical protein
MRHWAASPCLARRVAEALLWLCLLPVGCHARARPARSDPPLIDPKAKPRAPGVALDPTFVLPSARTGARTDHEVMVLLTPADTGGARSLVHQFLEDVVREDFADLSSLFADQAFVIIDRTGRRLPAAAFWQQRLARLDYGLLRGLVVYQDRRLETYRAEDVARLARTRLFAVRGADLTVRVPIQTPRVGRTQLLGEEIWFVLRPGPNGYRIAQMLEDFDTP